MPYAILFTCTCPVDGAIIIKKQTKKNYISGWTNKKKKINNGRLIRNSIKKLPFQSFTAVSGSSSQLRKAGRHHWLLEKNSESLHSLRKESLLDGFFAERFAVDKSDVVMCSYLNGADSNTKLQLIVSTF